MEVFVLEVKHIYDEEFETCGIFTSETNMKTGKKEYLKAKQKESFKLDEFRFTHTKMELDRVYF